jgi:hypothetical protein
MAEQIDLGSHAFRAMDKNSCRSRAQGGCHRGFARAGTRSPGGPVYDEIEARVGR